MPGLYDYLKGRQMESIALNKRIPFYSVIQCAMRMADTDNLDKLKSAFPDEWKDLNARYDAPNGILEGELNDQIRS